MSQHKETLANSGGIVTRLSVTLVLFSGVLTLALVASHFLILPSLTRVEVDGTERDLNGLREYHIMLQAQLSALEQQRNDLVLPVQNPLFTHLKKEKEQHEDFLSLIEAFNGAAESFRSGGEDTVVYSGFRWNEADRTLKVAGDVRNVGLRSMTVLVQFAESLSDLPQVNHVKHPRYERFVDETIGPHSPFTIFLEVK
jgi:hypothetical protein